MIKSTLTKAALFAVLLIGTYFAGYYSHPVLEESKTQIAENEDESKEKNVETVRIETEITEPDGTKIKQVETRKKKETKKESSSAKNIETEQKTDYGRPQWSIGLYSSIDKKVTLTVDRRILGNVFVGAYGRIDTLRPSDHEVGLGLRLEF